jgi:histidinol-phosphatase (PHP family)
MLEEAFRKGFKTYCLSEHVPRSGSSQLYPEEIEAGLSPSKLHQRFEEYLVEARQCASSWNGKLNVLVGAELENIDDECIEYLQDVLDGHTSSGQSRTKDGSIAGRGRIDYVIGSLHHVDSIPIDFDKETFERALDSFRQDGDHEGQTDEQVLRERAHLRLILRYLKEQEQLIHHFQPEVVGHFDLCRLFEPDTPMTMIASKGIIDPVCLTLLQQVDAAVHSNIELVCSYNGLFEVNSASLRKGWKTPYPGEDVLDVILAKGGRLCLSDDAHSHEQIGLNYQKVKHFLESKGVNEIWTLQLDDGSPIPKDSTRFPRGTVSVKVTDWTSDSFWQMNNQPM